MKVLIIEDEQRAAERLIKLIAEIDNSIEIVSIIDSIENSVKWFRQNTHPDLIFLDIQLSDGLCFNIFNQTEVNSPVIFTTAYDEYALKAFELNSIDYLLKPIDADKLKIGVRKYHKLKSNIPDAGINVNFKKILSEISLNSKVYKSRFLISKSDSLLVIDINRIAYFYSEQKATFIITTDNQKYITNDSLDQVVSSIDPSLFFRINRQYVVSIKAIVKISNYFNYKLKLDLIPETNSDDTIVSRTKVSEFKQWLNK
ncbi:MAG: LytTR family DNA-binding domain-containing protein [Bacteroidota bacterium]|nr:LytTR family DNA-binding domain-containing protein [Bacteroidota bacterium]